MARPDTRITIVQSRTSNEDMASATIAGATAQSERVDVSLYGARNFVVVLTNGWTDADLGFLASYDTVIDSPLYNADGTRVVALGIGTIAEGLSRAIVIPATYGLGNARSIILQSLDTSTGALLVQGSPRAIQLIPLY